MPLMTLSPSSFLNDIVKPKLVSRRRNAFSLPPTPTKKREDLKKDNWSMQGEAASHSDDEIAAAMTSVQNDFENIGRDLDKKELAGSSSLVSSLTSSSTRSGTTCESSSSSHSFLSDSSEEIEEGNSHTYRNNKRCSILKRNSRNRTIAQNLLNDGAISSSTSGHQKEVSFNPQPDVRHFISDQDRKCRPENPALDDLYLKRIERYNRNKVVATQQATAPVVEVVDPRKHVKLSVAHLSDVACLADLPCVGANVYRYSDKHSDYLRRKNVQQRPLQLSSEVEGAGVMELLRRDLRQMKALRRKMQETLPGEGLTSSARPGSSSSSRFLNSSTSSDLAMFAELME